MGGTWWAVSGGWYMVGSEWWAVGNDFFAIDCIQNGRLCLFTHG